MTASQGSEVIVTLKYDQQPPCIFDCAVALNLLARLGLLSVPVLIHRFISFPPSILWVILLSLPCIFPRFPFPSVLLHCESIDCGRCCNREVQRSLGSPDSPWSLNREDSAPYRLTQLQFIWSGSIKTNR